MRIRIMLLLSFLSLGVFAQQIEGVVLDAETKEAIVAAHISVDEKVLSVTNAKGAFELKLDVTNDQTNFMFVSHVGYSTQKVQIPKTPNEKLMIYLVPENTELKEVQIDSKKKLQAKIKYTESASLEKGLYGFASGIHNGKIYVIGGENSEKVDRSKAAIRATNDKFIEPTFDNLMSQMDFVSGSIENVSGAMMMYDIEQDAWTTSDLEFRERAAHNLHIYKDEIYVLGGKRIAGNNVYLDDVIEIYNLKSKVIKEDTPNPHQAVNFASFLYGDYLILIGGIKKITKRGKKEYTKDIHFYNMISGLWYKLGEMPTAKETNGVLINDVIYLMGGFNKRPLNTIESFNLKTGKWHVEGKLFKGMERPAIANNGNTIYLYNDQRISTYNVTTKQLNEYFIDLDVESATLFYYNDSLYFIGGNIQDGFYSKPSRKVYRINVNEFSKTRIRNSKKTQRKGNS
ncbi:N-acetylneuraminate epimerase [Kordia sp. SMS9]|uniref:Kelch repeat-containing protein n=1 Tax=Kordia sp. SMS9 TaxID=2282170 RepID=UPI000E0D9E6B|nr:carboxypeptidase-like regulatory domain-containing protein [Kordia sp. SMS9]AXG70235.1 N-acetylneuraminate epimerase [Kordia sp. SMS9]